MKPQATQIAAMLAAVLAGALIGYLGEEISRPPVVGTERPAPAGERLGQNGRAALAARVFEPAPLPETRLTDAQGFDAFVADLVRRGFSEKHAHWIALRMRSGQDMAASLALAREREELDLWAAGAVEVDPAQAFALLQGLDYRERTSARTEFFATLGRLDPQAGLGFLARLNMTSNSDARAMVDFFRNWAAVASLDAAADAVKKLPARAQRSALFGLFNAWGETDREGMLEWATAQGPKEAKLAMRALNTSGAIRNPEELFDLVTRFPAATDWLMLAVATGQLADQGADGFRVVAELPPSPMRASTIGRFASGFARHDPAGAWELMVTLPPEDQARFFEGAISSFSKIKPREVAEKLASGEFGMGHFSSLMEEWTRQDPQQALDWSRRNLAGRTLLESVGAVFSAWEGRSPVDAATALRGLPAGLRASALPSAAADFGAADPHAALAWAEQLPAAERPLATSGAIRGWAANNPAAAAQALAGLPSQGMDEAFKVVSREFAQSDPAAATQWAAGLTDARRRDDAIRDVVGTWAMQNAESASEYLAGLAPGGFRDRAIDGFVTSVRGLDPASAAAWAASIQSPDLQRSNLRRVLGLWRGKDRAAAQAFARGIQDESLRTEMLKVASE